MKKLIIILLFITTSLHAEKIERLGFYNIQEILGDDKLTYKIIKGCVSMNSAVTEIIKEEYPVTLCLTTNFDAFKFFSIRWKIYI